MSLLDTRPAPSADETRPITGRARLMLQRFQPNQLAAIGIALTTSLIACIMIGESQTPGDTARVVSFLAWDWAVPKWLGPVEHRHMLAVIEAIAILLVLVRWALRAAQNRWRNLVTSALLVSCLVAAGTLAGGRYAGFRPQAFDTRDDFHYLLGAKYFDELGYDNLYECAAVLEIERGTDNIKFIRDLATNHMFRASDLAKDEVRQHGCIERFSPQRWEAFRFDISQFRGWIEPWAGQWPRMFTDHGYNGPPVLTAILSAVGNAVPIDHKSLSLLGLVNLAAVAAMLFAALWAFGWEAAVVCGVTFFCSAVDGFGHAMSIPRYLWLSSLVVGVCLLKRERYGASAVCLVLSTFLKVFPVFFLAAAYVHVFVLLRRRGHWSNFGSWRPGRFVTWSCATTALLLGLTLVVYPGPDGWLGFFEQMQLNGNRKAGGCIGFEFNFTYPTTEPKFNRMISTLKETVFGLRLRTVMRIAAVAVALLVARHAGRMSGATTVLLFGFTLMHLFAVPMRYYYAGYFGLALLFARDGRPDVWRVSVVFLLALDALAKVVGVHTRETFVMTGLMSLGFTSYIVGIILYLEHQRGNGRLP